MSAPILHLWLTFGIAVFAMVAVLITLIVTVAAFQGDDNPAETIVAVMGSATTVIGTIAGLVAGHSAGSAGKERAEDRAAQAQIDRAAAQESAAKLTGFVAAYPEPAVLQKARAAFPELFEKEAPQS